MSSSAISPDKITQIARIVSERLSGHLSEELAGIHIPDPVEHERVPATLVGAMDAIRAAGGQAGALRALLSGCVSLGARAAVFVLRDDHIEIWESEGFGDGLTQGRVPIAEDAVARALSGQSVDCSMGDEITCPDFGQGTPTSAQWEPIRVQDKVAGLLYADTLDEELVQDTSGIRILAMMTGVAVERLALLKALGQQAASQETGETPVESEAVPPAAVTKTPESEAQEEPEAPGMGVRAVATAPSPTVTPKPAYEPVPSLPEASEGSSPEIEDARRFARLLMEEICLYNGDKVEAGRAGKDLLARLGDEVEQARAMYTQRVPAEVASQGDFFDEAVLSVLAAGEESALGVRTLPS